MGLYIYYIFSRDIYILRKTACNLLSYVKLTKIHLYFQFTIKVMSWLYNILFYYQLLQLLIKTDPTVHTIKCNEIVVMDSFIFRRLKLGSSYLALGGQLSARKEKQYYWISVLLVSSKNHVYLRHLYCFEHFFETCHQTVQI